MLDNNDLNEIAKALSDNTLSTNDKNYGLTSAVVQENVELVKLFLDYAANPNTRTDNPYGPPAMLKVAESLNYEMLELILEYGGDPNCNFEGGARPLFVIIETLIENGAEGDTRMLELLIDRGADLHYKWKELGNITPIGLLTPVQLTSLGIKSASLGVKSSQKSLE
ncbi:hypothetical protein [Deinococcus sp. QL22]|uniref:hypothetical protein n=1 Tax=Deinococcus sp. QL22 TaxID=2939437 RepID=UPI002016EC73|nr:hypothetical protein [Deinococcus sp. QL22]UQN10716.1 hypothetical protein M1R55_30560 [Deinococcus sp. QL22]